MIELAEVLDGWLAEEFPTHRFYIYYSTEVACECRYIVKLRDRTVCHIMDDYVNVRTGIYVDLDKVPTAPYSWVKVDLVEPDSFVKLRDWITARIKYITETDDWAGRPPDDN